MFSFLNPSNWFGSRQMIGESIESQRLDQQRSHLGSISTNVYGNKYFKKDISLDFDATFNYYYNITALNVAVNKIAQDCSKTKITEVDSDAEVTNIFDSSNKRVIRTSIINLLLTGNVFIRVFGSVKQKVNKMQVLDSRVIDFNNSDQLVKNNDMFYVGKIKYTFDFMSKVFIADDELSYIFVIKNESNHTNYGVSPLNNLLVKMDWINEYENRNTNNMSTGINANIIISPDERIDQDDMDNFISKYSQRGSRNGVMWTPFPIKSSIDISQKTDDLATYAKYEQSIYDVFHIPAPMIMGSQQTFNNFAEAIEQYTEEAIIPNLEIWKEGINYVLSLANPSFKGLDLKITKESITLQKQKLERMSLLKDINFITINEKRLESGYDDIGVAGDILDNDNGII